MSTTSTSSFINTNDIKLHYLDYSGDGPTLILMHGLTANAHAFDGLIAAGLNKGLHVLSVDLRGRGLSDHPDEGYSMAAHAADILGLLDHLGIKSALIGGHSFGALLTLYLATHFPDRVEKMIILDAAAQLHPNTREMLMPTLSRLDRTFPSFDDYLQMVKSAPYNTFWEDAMLSFYQADIQENTDGTVIPRSKLENIGAAAVNVMSEPWLDYIQGATQPAILINATENYTLGAPLLPKDNALETVSMMQNCKYAEVAGNHQTMLYGKGAVEIVEAIQHFVLKKS